MHHNYWSFPYTSMDELCIIMGKREALNNQQQSLYRVSDLLAKGLIDLDDLADIIPGILHINSRKDLAIDFISKKGCDLIRYSREELNTLGGKVLERHQSDYAINEIYPKIINEFAKDDRGKIIPFFQDWRHTPNDNPFYLFTSTRILNEHQLISVSLFPDEIENLCRKVDKLFGINQLIKSHFSSYQLLTKREKEILNLLGKEMSRKEIASLLFIDPKTVKKHCENLFKKLGTNRRTELQRIAVAFQSL